MQFISSFVNSSEVRNVILVLGERSLTRLQMAERRCVLPNPTPPYTKSGLYALAGLSATACAAACANWLDGPTTKLLKVYFGFKLCSFVLGLGGSGTGSLSASGTSSVSRAAEASS